jgi:hypothetical protein
MPAPSIKFIDSLVGPSQVTKQWRDTVGVIGTFSRGPESPILVEDLKTFASIYGVDSSSGSLFVQQAMANGLNRFVVVRASASSNPSYSALTFTSGNAQISPVIGYVLNGNSLEPSSYRTTGLKIDFDYIGSPISINPTFSPVNSRRGQVNLPNFVGQARFNFYVTKAVEGRSSSPLLHDTTKKLTVDTILGPTPGYFLGLINTAPNSNPDYATLKEYIRPGYSLVSTETSLSVSDNLIIASDIIPNYSQDNDALLIRSDKKHSHAVWGVVSGVESGQSQVKVGFIKVKPRPTTLSEDYVQTTVNGTTETNTFKALKEMVLLIDGVEYKQSSTAPVPETSSVFALNAAVNTVDGLGDDLDFSFDDLVDENLSEGTALDNIAGTRFTFTLASGTSTRAIQGGSTVTFLPKVSAKTDNNKTITITGLYSYTAAMEGQGVTDPDDNILSSTTKDKYYLVIKGKKYTISDVVTVTGNPEQLSITLVEDYTGTVGDAVYIYYRPTSVTGNLETEYKIHAPKIAQYVMGYSFDSQSGSMDSDYFPLTQSYNTGTGTVQLDNTFLLTERAGGRYISFGYFVKAPFETDYTSKAFPVLTKPFGIELMYGTQGVAALPLSTGGSFAVPFAKTSITLGSSSAGDPNAFQDGDLATDITKSIETALRSNSVISYLISNITLEDSILVDNATEFKPSISFTSFYSGEQANRINWKATRYTNDPQGSSTKVKDLLLGAKATTDANYGRTNYFEGGYDGPSFAFRDLYSADGTLLWRIESGTPGLHGNNISCTVRNQKTNGNYASFEIEVRDQNTTVISSDSRIVTVVNSSLIDFTTGRSLAFSSTSLVQAYFMPVVSAISGNLALDATKNRFFRLSPQRLAPPLEKISSSFSGGDTGFSRQGSTALSSFFLKGGSDGTLTAPSKKSLAQGLIRGLEALDSINVAAIALPGINYGDQDYQAVFEKAVHSVNSSTPESGLRTAVFELAPGINADRAATLAAELDNERIVLLAGSQLMRGDNGLLVPNVGSSGSYLGYDLSRAPNLSPAASYSGALVRRVTSVDTLTNTAFLDKMSDAGVEVLLFDANIGGFRFCNGLTTSKQLAKRYRSVVRTLDQVKTDLYLALQWCRSRPNTPQLQSEVASACDTYLYSKLRDGWFSNLQPTICSEANNTVRDQLEGRLNVRIRFTPSFPADTIVVSTIMDISDDFTIQTTI